MFFCSSSHLKPLDKNLHTCNFFIPNLTTSLQIFICGSNAFLLGVVGP